ncbi:hypothetical protein, partial [Pseudoalteromonas holothuriae]
SNALNTDYLYDALGRLAQTIQGDQVTNYEYDDNNNLVKKAALIGAQRNKTEYFVYNEANQLSANLVSVNNTEYQVSRFDYDNNGKQIAQHQYQSFMPTPNENNVASSLKAFTDEHTAVSNYTSYDKSGRKSLHINADGGVTQWHYDAQGRVYELIRWGAR